MTVYQYGFKNNNRWIDNICLRSKPVSPNVVSSFVSDNIENGWLDWMTRWLDDWMTRWPDDRELCRRLTVWYIYLPAILILFLQKQSSPNILNNARSVNLCAEVIPVMRRCDISPDTWFLLVQGFPLEHQEAVIWSSLEVVPALAVGDNLELGQMCYLGAWSHQLRKN